MWYKVISIKTMKIRLFNPSYAPVSTKPPFYTSFGKSGSDFAAVVEDTKTELITQLSKSTTLPNVKILLDKLAGKILQDLDTMTCPPAGDTILDWCSDFCKSFHKSDFMQDKSLPEQTRDNVIVDFLNSLCRKYKMSSCIFVSDLRNPA